MIASRRLPTSIDTDGNPTEDPKWGVLQPFGAMLCFGEHKGYGMAVACELLGGALTGSGKASKEQIQHAVRSELRLERLLEPYDVADAFAIALCHYHAVRIL